MRIYLSIFFSLFLLAASAHAQTNNQGTRFFPPDNCVPGQMNILTWDGGSVTRCEQVPTCTSPAHLEFNGHNFQCATDSSCLPPTPVLCPQGQHAAYDRDAQGCTINPHCEPDQPIVPCPDILCVAGNHAEETGEIRNGCSVRKCVPDNSSPSLSASPTSGPAPLNVSFLFTTSQLGGYAVQTGDGTFVTLIPSPGVACPPNDSQCLKRPQQFSAQYTYKTAGTFTAYVTTTDPCPQEGGYTLCERARLATVTITVTDGISQGSCAATTVQWNQGNENCAGPIYIDGAVNQTVDVVAPGATDDNAGKAEFKCVATFSQCVNDPHAPCNPEQKFLWQVQPGATCAAWGRTCDYAACPEGQHHEDTGNVIGGCKELRCVPDQVKPICPMILNQACAPGSHFVEGPTGNDGCPRPGHCEKDVSSVCIVDCIQGYHPSVEKDANGCSKECLPDKTDVTTVPPHKPFCGGISTQCARGFHEAWDNGKQANGCPLPAKCVKN